MREKGSTERGGRASPSRCEDVLRGTLQGLGLGRVIRHLALLKAWDRAVAPRVRERATVQDFSDGRLYLCVEDPIWLHELHMLRHKLKMILNEEIGEPVVNEIVLRIGRSPRSATSAIPNRREERPPVVPTEAEAKVQQILAPVQDRPCRDVLERLFYRWRARPM